VSNNVGPVAALADMLKLIQNYPAHPDATKWLVDFREMVKAASEPSGEVAEKPAGTQ
jgi:hypothetical protein